jgi:hypothetical protein
LDRLEIESHIGWIEELNITTELHGDGQLQENCPLGGGTDLEVGGLDLHVFGENVSRKIISCVETSRL